MKVLLNFSHVFLSSSKAFQNCRHVTILHEYCEQNEKELSRQFIKTLNKIIENFQKSKKTCITTLIEYTRIKQSQHLSFRQGSDKHLKHVWLFLYCNNSNNSEPDDIYLTGQIRHRGTIMVKKCRWILLRCEHKIWILVINDKTIWIDFFSLCCANIRLVKTLSCILYTGPRHVSGNSLQKQTCELFLVLRI